MKKLLLALIISLVFNGGAFAQTSYDLDFSYKLTGKNDGDTLKTHNQYDIEVDIFNNGPDAFTGSLKFRVAVYDSAGWPGKVPVFPPKFTSYEIQQTIPTFTLQPNQNANLTLVKGLDINPSDFRPDTMNIVIIWPSEGYIDTDTSNDYARLEYYIIEGVNSIKKPEAFSGVSIYPNPAQNSVQISFESVRRGELLISDISGKVLIRQTVSAGKQKLNVPLEANGTALANGLYFVTLQSAETRSVHKLQVTK